MSLHAKNCVCRLNGLAYGQYKDKEEKTQKKNVKFKNENFINLKKTFPPIVLNKQAKAGGKQGQVRGQAQAVPFKTSKVTSPATLTFILCRNNCSQVQVNVNTFNNSRAQIFRK